MLIFMLYFALFGICIIVAPAVFGVVLPLLYLLWRWLIRPIVLWTPAVLLFGFVSYGIIQGCRENAAFANVMLWLFASGTMALTLYYGVVRPCLSLQPAKRAKRQA